MSKDKKGFLLYKSLYEPVKDLSQEEKGQLFDAIFYYQIHSEEMPNMTPLVKMAFGFFKNQFNVDQEKYNTRCEKARESIKKRWNKTNEKDTNVYERIQRNTNDTDKSNKIKDTSNKIEDKREKIDIIYKHYPSKCKNRGTSTGKSSKDKEKIAKLLKTHSEEHLIACIDFAIKEGQKGMLKNFSTFLNNLPDLDEVNQDQEQEKQIKDIVFKYTSIPGNIWKSQDEYDKWEYRLKWKHDKNGIGTPYPKYLEGAIKVKLGI